MDIKHLRYFVAMAESGSLMKAAERLHVAQPALSVHLSNLEMELGMTLFERSNRGIALTEEGRILYERATGLIDYYNNEILAMKRGKSVPAGHVTLGLPSTMPGIFAPHLYHAMREQLPEVSLYLLDASTAALFEWLQDGKIDFAALFNIHEDAIITLSPLFMEDCWLIGRFDETEDGTDIPFHRVFDYPLTLPGRSTSWRKILDEQAEALGRTLSSAFETDSYAALRALAQSGECYSILPRSSIMQDHLEGIVKARRIVEPEMHGLLSLANLKSTELTHTQKAARDVLIATIRKVAAQLGLGTGKTTIPKVYPSSLFANRHYPQGARKG